MYGNLEASRRPKTWKILKNLKSSDGFPWLILGDFNEILNPYEKFWGRDRLERQMVDFREMLSVCEMWDLGFVGSPFTWCNNKECELFSHGCVNHGSAAYSDYCPI